MPLTDMTAPSNRQETENRFAVSNSRPGGVILPVHTASHQPHILIINTGGTIGMKRTIHGYAPFPGQIGAFIDLLKANMADQLPHIDLIEYNPLLDSSDISAKDWVRIAADVAAHESLYDGFVILHGTDTMAYTASALSFMLRGLNKPVVITGAQLPLSRLRSDGQENLTTAMLLAAFSRIPEVCLYFGGKLLRGNRATKVSADNLQAFDSPNYPPLAEAGVDLRYFPNRCRPAGDGIVLQPFHEQRIGVLKIFPGLQFSLFDNLIDKGLNGLILEAFGVGNIPFGNTALINLLHSCAEHNIVTVVCTQCHQGRARLGEYAASSELCALGAVSGLDLTVEAAVTKLTYLLSKETDYEKICSFMGQDLAGELSADYAAARE